MPRGKPNHKVEPAVQQADAGTHTAECPDPLEAPCVKTIPMVRDADTNQPPHTADVHPDEVENWRAWGWRMAD